jgi:hypothetical protein
VHRPIGEQGEDGGADIAAARPWPTAAATGSEAAAAGELLADVAAGMTVMVV